MSEKKVPKIRFPGFTGEWEEQELGTLVTRYEDHVETPHNGYERLGIRSHAKGTFHSYVAPGEELETAKMQRVASDKFIVNITFAWEHAVAVTDAEDAGKLVSHRFPQFSFRYGLDPSFFKYAMLDKRFKKHLELSSPGGAGRNRVLKIEDMLKYRIAVPSIEEQQKVSWLLDNVNDHIVYAETELNKWKELKKGMLQKMLPKEGESVPEIRFPGFEGQWKRYKLEDVTDEFRSGTFIAATDIIDDGEYPVYGGNGLRGYANTYNHDGEFALIGRQGALCGNVNYSCGKAYFTEHAVAVKANRSMNTKFLFYLLGLMKLGQYSDQSAQPGLAVGKLVKLENVFPSKQEQERISNLFSSLDSIISNLQREVMKWQSLKKALLQQMFV